MDNRNCLLNSPHLQGVYSALASLTGIDLVMAMVAMSLLIGWLEWLYSAIQILMYGAVQYRS